MNLNPNVETGIFVNLGWVPKENKDDIEMGSEPVPLLENYPANSTKAFNKNPYTGLFIFLIKKVLLWIRNL